jgi:DUF2075 family protein
LMEKNPQEAKMILRRIIKNTYRTLMTRGKYPFGQIHIASDNMSI